MSDNGGHPLEDGQETMDQLAIAMLAPVVNLGVAPYPRLNPGEQPESSGIYTVHVGPRSLGGGDPIWTLASWLSDPELKSLRRRSVRRATTPSLRQKSLSGRPKAADPLSAQCHLGGRADPRVWGSRGSG